MSTTTILIVEDEVIVAENLHMRLEQLGYAVAGIAVKGEEAIEMALRLKPQLILMDIQLNGQEDGIHAAEMIRAQYDVPVIYLTAHSDPATPGPRQTHRTVRLHFKALRDARPIDADRTCPLQT
jgi:two-component system, cell cycle sensor histidine kinase and response regulator CckA